MTPYHCRWTSLEVGVIVVAVTNVVICFHTAYNSPHRTLTNVYEYWQRLPPAHQPFWIADMFLQTTAILVAIGLFIGSQKKNATLCWIWIGHTVAYMILIAIFLLFIERKCCDLVWPPYYPYDKYWIHLGHFVWDIVQVFFVCVVLTYIRTLRQVGPQQANVELGSLTPAGTQLQLQPSAIGQEGAVPVSSSTTQSQSFIS